MNSKKIGSRCVLRAGGILTLLAAGVALVALLPGSSRAGWFDSWFAGNDCDHHGCCGNAGAGCPIDYQWVGEPGGTWYWLRSPEEERKTIIGLFNRYCIRCHGVDGRGIWDIPGIPDFTNPRFHACRSDGQLVRAILEGRGAVMPPFRGALTLEEGWGLARYLRTFLPDSGTPRPDSGPADKDSPGKSKQEATPGKNPATDTVPGAKDKKFSKEIERKG
jgi:hypothetical protein